MHSEPAALEMPAMISAANFGSLVYFLIFDRIDELTLSLSYLGRGRRRS
jgi:hypothetical protein